MSRIGKRPIEIPKGVTVNIEGRHVSVKGPKGQLERTLPETSIIAQNNGIIEVQRQSDSRVARQRHGLCRTLVANMVEGVSKGYEKRLSIIGIGYRSQVQGTTLVLNVGYSKPVEIAASEGIKFEVAEKGLEVIVSGINKEIVGNVAAKIRAVRPPEVYKGKGIRYKGEYVRRKAGKAGKK
ncbi:MULTISPECIES: 50S ribosomal protein L6 [Spirulina sp. CCY15215]|jgi:large subunit ribosomal protein L6|uniref:50S ribosomal protein L6 n=1 Tax=Spirulina sp. CCY15215 TaxID=2767591 RepID=UPI00194E46C5|nr:50S ribosomal protein L6 [Spirulina major]